MSTLFYIGDGGGDIQKSNTKIDEKYRHTEDISTRIKNIYDQMNFSISGVLEGKNGKKIQQMSVIFGDQGNKNEQNETLEFLKDHHGTFTIFEKAILAACTETLKGEKVFVDIYIKDISNPEFLKTMHAIKNGGIQAELIVIDIRSDDYGVFDSRVTNNLSQIIRLGFEFSVSDFVIQGSEVHADNLTKCLKERLIPSFVKIVESVYSKIKEGTVEVGKNIQSLLDIIYKKNIIILLVKGDSYIPLHKKIESHVSFLESAHVIPEDILTLDGELYAQEGLIRFGEDIHVQEGLKILQNLGLVSLLTDRVINESIRAIENGTRRSVNIYIKELYESEFYTKIQRLSKRLPKPMRKDLIFEILETKYGALNCKALDNLRLLQNLGFAIVIDDLCICGQVNLVSLELFEILLEEKILPEYIKIEGIYAEEIREGTLSEYHLHYLREIIGLISLLPKKPIVIFEWIQDTHHAVLIEKVLGLDGVQFLYQGRSIKHGSFGYTLLPK
ncbi:EAL domain-containing protein [Candidatus Gracilibacteria bacterium]|nr:EAL domain-containing protein [Candidatus Gracilibacteria bacterium]